MTAETAVALPALAVVLALSLWAVAAVTAQLQCVDAARVAARAVARGESPARSTAVARAAAPRGASISIAPTDGLVVVEVRSRARFPGPWGRRAPSLVVAGSAAATREESVAPEPFP